MKKLPLLFLTFLLSWGNLCQSQHSIARQWNEELLHAIRNDFARPTVHARNLFHSSVAMYDAWAAYDEEAEPFFLGKTIQGFNCELDSFPMPEDINAAREEAMSYAVYRLMNNRFLFSPGGSEILPRLDTFMMDLGYDINFSSTNYQQGSAAALGNYIAQCLINFGFQDNSNEQFGYINLYYEPVNPELVMSMPGNPTIVDPNRWQPLSLDVFIDQSGNEVPISAPAFLSPEWGQCIPFALGKEDLTIYNRDNFDYWVYHDPGAPPYLDTTAVGGLSEEYKWGFSLVSIWSSHLDPADTTMWDISPASIGNIELDEYPTTIEGLRSFYKEFEGGDIGEGHDINPYTGEAYTPQLVKRADYARVLAEFWADGPDSETPPGHWFTILNYVNDHPLFEKKYRGQGEVLDELEWDVKAYLMMGGAMHDAAITAWGIKGWYDYIRPVSAIRAMAEYGQSTDSLLPSYHPGGIPLVPGFIELVEEGDSLAGENNENVGKIKIYAWRGPDFIEVPETDIAGVGWILAEGWWPYQRPTFVTPPFAGYVSGHSTYSRAAAEVMTMLTGDAFFPGGIGEFIAEKNEFLVFEDGPSEDIILQWATYRDASEQTSLSRIWGGIHPPADDIPGRLMGIKIGIDAFDKAEALFYNDVDKDGFFSFEDCDDNNAAIHPDVVEVCDGIDNNCNGLVDEDIPVVTYYFDSDGDLFGDANITLDTCLSAPPSGYVEVAGDCDDTNAAFNPSIVEICDDLDNNCDGNVDEGLEVTTYYLDSDGDSYGDPAMALESCLSEPLADYVLLGGDCDDSNAAIHPDAMEVLDSLDNDCNGMIDDGISSTQNNYQRAFQLFPNPVNESLHLQGDFSGQAQAQIFRADGVLVDTKTLNFVNDNASLSFKHLSKGVYFLVLNRLEGEQLFVGKVVK